MEEKEPVSYALLDSLFYLSQTEIPVRQRYGENVVIYNHKNRMTLPIDKDGKSVLEGNGVYTVESLTSPLVKGSVGVQETKSLEVGEKKSIFKSLGLTSGTATVGKGKRVSMGILPTLQSPTSAQGAGGSQEIPTLAGRRPSLQPMSLFLAKSATTLDSDANKSTTSSTLNTPHVFGKFNKGKRVSNAEETVKAFAAVERIKEDDDQLEEEDSVSYDLSQLTSSGPRDSTRDSVQKSRASSVSPDTPEIVITPDKSKPSPKRKNSVSRSTADLLTKSIAAFTGATNSTLSPDKGSPVRRGSSIGEIQTLKIKNEDIYNGILSTTIESELRDVYVRIDDTTMTVSNCAQSETFLELDLKKAIATPKRTSLEFEFDFISPRLRQSFIAPTYLKMIEWMAVINSVASTLVIEPTGNMYSDMYADIFEREYRILLHQIETRDSNVELYDVKFEPFLNDNSPRKVEMLERSMFRINSSDDGVIKYDPELPKTPFNIAGASIDKLVERLTDIYGPDQKFINLILHTYRCFTDSPTLLKKLIARMSPILKQNETNMAGWKPVIKLRAIAVIFRWMCLAWKPDFQNEVAKSLTVEFFNAISASFGNGNDQDKVLDTKYGAKFETIKKSFQKRLDSSKRNSTLSQTGSGSNQTQSFHNRDSGMLRDYSPSVVRAAITKTKVEFAAVETDAIVIALTDKEQGQLLQITPLTLLLHLWQSKEPLVLDLIKPINDMVESFNAMSFWVATEITTQPEMKNRVATIEKFIKIANHCFKLNNFNTTMAIVSGLNLNSISRLKQTWEVVDPKKKRQLEKLEEIMTPLGNYKAYRAYVAEMDTNCPHIPVVSLMLKDLLFAHDGNPTILADKETKTLINFSKLKSIYDRVAIFSKLHKSNTFQIPKDTPGFVIAEEYCQHLRRLNEQQLYKYSLLCEPKVGDEHLNLRGKWMTQK